MILPFLSRSTHEAIVEMWKARLADSAERNLMLTKQVAQLQTEYHQTVTRLTTPPVVESPPTASPHRERSVIATAISEQAAGDPRLAAYLRKRARELKSEGKSEDVIAIELGHWHTTEPSEGSDMAVLA